MGDIPIEPIRRARVEVAPELIAKALHFPVGTDIRYIEWGRGVQGEVAILIVEHPDLDPVDEGAMAPVVTPKVTYHRESWDFDWGQETTPERVGEPLVANPLGVIPPYQEKPESGSSETV